MASLDADNDDFNDNFNEVMSWIDFHAPAAPMTCTLTIFVSDLGNNGMPLAGEVPNFAFDIDTAVFEVVDSNAPAETPPGDAPPEDVAAGGDSAGRDAAGGDSARRHPAAGRNAARKHAEMPHARRRPLPA